MGRQFHGGPAYWAVTSPVAFEPRIDGVDSEGRWSCLYSTSESIWQLGHVGEEQPRPNIELADYSNQDECANKVHNWLYCWNWADESVNFQMETVTDERSIVLKVHRSLRWCCAHVLPARIMKAKA